MDGQEERYVSSLVNSPKEEEKDFEDEPAPDVSPSTFAELERIRKNSGLSPLDKVMQKVEHWSKEREYRNMAKGIAQEFTQRMKPSMYDLEYTGSIGHDGLTRQLEQLNEIFFQTSYGQMGKEYEFTSLKSFANQSDLDSEERKELEELRDVFSESNASYRKPSEHLQASDFAFSPKIKKEMQSYLNELVKQKVLEQRGSKYVFRKTLEPLDQKKLLEAVVNEVIPAYTRALMHIDKLGRKIHQRTSFAATFNAERRQDKRKK